MPSSIRGFVHERRRWVALIVVCFAMLMNTLDQTIVNVALPTIQRDLHFTQASLAWVIDAYLITFAGTLLLAGRLGDLIGRKKVFLVGVALFIRDPDGQLIELLPVGFRESLPPKP